MTAGAGTAPRTGPTAEQIRAVLDRVPDPEMPPVSIADLGMVVDVRVDSGETGARVEVDLVATFSGCPATALIREQAARAVADVEGVDEVEVRFVRDVVWTPERISPKGRENLRTFAIAPPGSGQGTTGGGLVQIGRVRCPVCASRNTTVDSPFGPTPCRSTHYCNDCKNPFEAIKP